MRAFNKFTRLIVVLGSFSVASLVSADNWSFGGTRVAGMGGAGLALPFDVVDNNVLNPAMLGYGPRRFGITEPGVSYDLGGVDLSRVSKDFSGIGNGGISSGKLLSFGQDFGQQQRDISFDVNVGLYFDGFALNGLGQAQVSTKPNATLEAFAANPTVNQAEASSGAQLDAYGIGYYSYGLSYGRLLPIQGGSHLSLGGALNVVHAYYSHYVAAYTGYDTETNTVTGSVNPGPEMNGASNVSKTGVGFDLGLLGDSKPSSEAGTASSPIYYGAVIRNLISPNIKFPEDAIATGSANDTSYTPKTLDPFKSRLDGGVGSQVSKKLLLAADWDDMGNRTGFSQLALGAQYSFFGNTALRAGYNTYAGFTAGVSLVGINVAVSARRTLVLGTEVKF